MEPAQQSTKKPRKPMQRRHERLPDPGPVVISERDRKLFQLLDPRYQFKYLTTSWIAEFLAADNPWKLDALKRRLRQLYDAGYLERPHQQRNSPNANYKHAVYERADKAAKESDAPRGAAHRSHSYPHELLVDIGFYAPLLLTGRQKGWTISTAKDLMNGAKFTVRTKEGVKSLGFPLSTRESSDPFAVELKDGKMRMDGTPIMIDRGDDLIFIPGIEVDRQTESLRNIKPSDPTRTTLTGHIAQILEFYRDKRSHYGFNGIFVPIVTTNETHTQNAMNFVREKIGDCKFIIFKTLPDLAFTDHFPAPSSEFITTPWKRVGHPDFVF